MPTHIVRQLVKRSRSRGLTRSVTRARPTFTLDTRRLAHARDFLSCTSTTFIVEAGMGRDPEATNGEWSKTDD